MLTGDQNWTCMLRLREEKDMQRVGIYLVCENTMDQEWDLSVNKYLCIIVCVYEVKWEYWHSLGAAKWCCVVASQVKLNWLPIGSFNMKLWSDGNIHSCTTLYLYPCDKGPFYCSPSDGIDLLWLCTVSPIEMYATLLGNQTSQGIVLSKRRAILKAATIIAQTSVCTKTNMSPAVVYDAMC